jgi:D-cysteine desulfhydrase
MPFVTTERPLFRAWPALERVAGFAALGQFPTPVVGLTRWLGVTKGADRTYVKRDDLSSPVYGGNKVRTLEAIFGQALREGTETIYATGAYGSNHAVATVLHAPRVGLRPGVLLFPQPPSATAIENLQVSLARAEWAEAMAHWAWLPLSWWQAQRRHGGFPAVRIMRPGGASPRGCLGFLSGALELFEQVDAGVLPRPDEVVLALGSTCSSAGLLLGLSVAARRSKRRGPPPALIAVRVTPWPVTSPVRIVSLALATARWLSALTGDPVFEVTRAELSAGLHVDPGYIGKGYGWPTAAGQLSAERLSPLVLDTTYCQKSAAALLDRLERKPDLVRVFWATKSAAQLPAVTAEELARAPARFRRWLALAAS